MHAGYDGDTIAPFSWWSWRPGIKPLYALLIGAVAMVPGLGLAGLGLLALFSGVHALVALLLLLLLGLALLCYPLLLARWGLRDLLIARYAPEMLSRLTAYVIARREVGGMTRRDRPGLMPRGASSWHGIAVLLPGETIPPRVLTLSVSAAMFSAAYEGAAVRIVYSPHVHYVYSLELVHEPA